MMATLIAKINTYSSIDVLHSHIRDKTMQYSVYSGSKGCRVNLQMEELLSIISPSSVLRNAIHARFSAVLDQRNV